MTILVTGASGFVGAALLEALQRRGEAVVAVDLQTLPPELEADLRAGEMTFCQADVTNQSSLRRAFQGRSVRAVVHGATVTANAARDATDPGTVLAVNMIGTANILQACRDAGVPRLVLASSNAAYGRNMFQNAPSREDQPVDPVSLYEITKFGAERVALRLGTLYGVDVRIARLSSVFGPWERATGVRDTLSPLLRLCQMAAAGHPARLARPHYRDWVHVRDVAEGLLALVDVASEAPELFNLGPGPDRGWTALAWGQRLQTYFPSFDCRLCAGDEAANVDLHLPNDRAPLDTGRLQTWTKFDATFDLDRAAADTVAWLRAHPRFLE